MKISQKSWSKYVSDLRKVNDAAADDFAAFFLTVRDPLSDEGRSALIEYAYGIGTKYGEAAAELSCEMYDSMAVANGVEIPPAVPAETLTYADAAKTVNGVLKQSQNVEEISSAVARHVKLAGVDTTMQNAIRDGVEWAWIPQGETCAFCITLASRGWQHASKKALKNGHAEHIHANCDCTYAIRFDSNTDVEGYDPEKYYEMYADAAPGKNSTQKINAMRREFYAENKERINAQKRDAYARRRALNSSEAEEINVGGITPTNKFGRPITFDEKIAERERYATSSRIVSDLSGEYVTRLENVTVGAERAAGDVDISGARMRLSSAQPDTALHEFAHTLANSSAQKYGLTDDEDFWKEIRQIYREYHRDVDKTQDVSRYISTYEHSARDVDEFFAEAFTLAKAKEMGIELPGKYGTDYTYADRVLAVVNKYFKK